MSNNYVDKYGRWHDKPVMPMNELPSNNAYAYTATAKLLGYLLDYSKIYDCFMESQTLYSFDRHPGTKYPAVSRDEIQGAIILGLMNPKQLINNKFYYSNLGSPVKSSLLTKIKIFWKLRKAHRREFAKYPEIRSIHYILPTQDQYFCHRVDGSSPGLFKSAYFFVSSLLTLRKKHRSSMVILWQKLEFLRQIGKINKLESMLLSKIDGRKAVEIYFGSQHPFSFLTVTK